MRYKYSQNTNVISAINWDIITHGEYFGMEQGGVMMALPLTVFKSAIDSIVAGDAENATFTPTGGIEATTIKGAIAELDTEKEDKSNKVTAFQATPDDTHYPSEKLVDDSLEAIKGVDYADGTLKSHEDRLDTLEGDVSTEGSVLKDIKDNAKDATYDNTDSGLTASTIKTAIDEVEGRVDTAEGEIEDLQTAETEIKGTGWTDETVKGNADNIDALETEISTVKVKTSENDLAIQDIRRDQTLANQSEASLTTSDYGIVALPKNATGNLKMKREGLTARQLVENGDFSSGTTGWINGGSSHSVTDKILTAIGDASQVYIREEQANTANVTAGDKLFLIARAKIDNVLGDIKLRTYDGTTTNIIDQELSPVADTYYVLSGITTIVNTGSLNVNITSFYADTATQNGKELVIDGNYGVTAVNLTSIFGAGNEPSASDCANIFPTYFADTKSVPMIGRYRGRGKNLWNPKLVPTVTDTGSGSVNIWNEGDTVRIQGILGAQGRIFIIGNGYEGKIGVGPSPSSLPYITGAGQFSYSEHISSIKPAIIYYDGTYTTLSPSTTITVTKGIQGFGYYSDSSRSINLTLRIQLELGSTATTYAPYEAHDLYLTAPEGKSVPSAKDSVEVQDGRLVHVKRVENIDDDVTPVYSQDAWATIDSWTAGANANLSVAETAGALRLTSTDVSGGYASKVLGAIQGKPILVRYRTSADSTGLRLYESTSLIFDGRLATSTDWVTGVLVIPATVPTTLFMGQIPGYVANSWFEIDWIWVGGKATGASGTGTALDLGSTFDSINVNYELATPITTPIDSDGNIPAGASVYWEPAIPDVGIYTTKFDIMDTDHPIASIDKLYKVDFATGAQTQLTDAVVAGDGLSFTSASLTDGDLVNVIYFYSVANPEGLTTAEYLNSNVVFADTADGKYYMAKPVFTNGVLQPVADWTVTEVV